MRVAYVSADPGVPVFGRNGSSVHVQEVLRGLTRRGASIDLFASRWDGEPPADLAEVRCRHLPPLPKGKDAPRERAALANNAALAALLAKCGPFDMIYERYSLWSHAGMAHARRNGVPGVLEVNAPLLEEQQKHRVLVHSEQAADVARTAFGAASALLAVSQGVARYLSRFAEARGRIHVVPNGVDATRFAERAIRPDRPFTVAFVGTLKPWHGVATLVAAFGILAGRNVPMRLLLIGDGPERKALEAQTHTLGIEPIVRFTGSVAPSEIPALLAGADAAIAPYPAMDDFYFSPLKIMEYMAAGLPVVASRVGDLAGIVAHDRTGLLVRPGDPLDLADALTHLAAEPARARALGAAGRELVREHHGWDNVVERILSIAGIAGAASIERSA